MLKIKTSLAFNVLRKQSEGYRTIKLEDGREYDLIGVDVDTKNGDKVSIRLEVLPNGLHNLYVASDEYFIEPPKDHRLIGKLMKKPTDESKRDTS